MLLPWMIGSDLAPGDAKSLRIAAEGLSLTEIRSIEQPEFSAAYDALWAEFGEKDEMEQVDVIARRLRWDPEAVLNGCCLTYEMLVITARDELVGVRDHTAIVIPGIRSAVVHLSHNLVAPAWRRSGIAGWLRALPIRAARRCLVAQGLPEDSAVTLVGEMEHSVPGDEARFQRLVSYEKAGFKKVDPGEVNYLQPDFRSFERIDASGGPRPLPFSLLVRRVCRENENSISGGEARHLAESLYRMYGVEFRERDMHPVYENLAGFPPPGARIALVPPTG